MSKTILSRLRESISQKPDARKARLREAMSFLLFLSRCISRRGISVFFALLLLIVPIVTQAATVAKPIKKDSYAAFTQALYSPSAAVQDVKSGAFLYQKDANTQRPIASISKVMTATVFLETKPKLYNQIFYTNSSDRIGATVPLRSGELITLKQVLMGTLIPSANNMAVTLSKSTRLSEKQFIAQMNTRAKELGLKKTQFVEPTGLSAQNMSTANEISKLGRYAFQAHRKYFREAEMHRVYSYKTKNSGRVMNLYSTNKFNGHGTLELIAFKTGYLPGTANRTLVAQIQQKSTKKQVIVTLLGNPQYGTIFDEAERLANWSFANYNFPK